MTDKLTNALAKLDRLGYVHGMGVLPEDGGDYVLLDDVAELAAKHDAEVAELRQQLAAAQADAERYRWLRTSEMEFGVQAPLRKDCWWKCAGELFPNKVDELIDAAIAQQKETTRNEC